MSPRFSPPCSEIEQRPDLRHRLWANAKALFEGVVAAGFEVSAKMSPVIALRMKDEETAIYAWNRLLESGVYVNLALPPGTPNGACLLRASVSAAHTPEQIAKVVARFAALAEDLAALEQATAARVPASL